MPERDYVVTAALVWSAIRDLNPEFVTQRIHVKAVSPGEAIRIADAVSKVLRIEAIHDVDNCAWLVGDVMVWHEKPGVES